MKNNLQKELEYFKEHQEEFMAHYKGKFLVIKNQKVEGVYETEIEAYNEAQKKFELGTFIIQQCLDDKEAYTQTFHSRVSFS
jgi:hypothetical protein